MAQTYSMTIAGAEREFPICPHDDKTDNAAFAMFSDAAERTDMIFPEKLPLFFK